MPDFLTVQGPTPNSYAPPKVDSSWVGNLVDNYYQGQLAPLQVQAQKAALAQQLFQLQAMRDYYGQGQGGGQPSGGQLGALGQGQAGAAQPTGGSDPRGLVPTIIDAAKQNNIDPNRFLAMNRGEGLANPNGDYENGKPTSFGSTQLHFRGRTKGLGDEYYAETGKDPSDPANEKDMIYWSARKLHETGWTPWTSTRKMGWGKWDGIGQQPTAAATTPGTRSDQLNPTDRAAVNAMYPTAAASPGPGAPSPGTQPTAPVGTAPVRTSEEAPEPGTTPPPFMGGTNQANPAGPTPPQQIAQAAGDPEDNPQVRAMDKRMQVLQNQLQQKGRAAVVPALAGAVKTDVEAIQKEIDRLQQNREKLVDRLSGERKMQLETGELQRRGEQAALTETGKKEQQDQLEYLRGVDREGIEATSHIGQLDTIAELAKKAPYGAFTGVKKFLGDYGIPTEGLTDIQAYEDAIAFMAPQLRPPGSGPLKNTEIEGFRRSLGGLLTTPEGRIVAVNNLKLMSQYKQDLGAIARNTDLTPSQRTQKMAEVPFPKLQTSLPGSTTNQQGVTAGKIKPGKYNWSPSGGLISQ